MGIQLSSVDKMAARGRHNTKPENLAKVKEQLLVVPEKILDAIEANGTRLILLEKGEDPLSVQPAQGPPLLETVDPGLYGPALGQSVAPVLEGIEEKVAHFDRLLQTSDSGLKQLLQQQRHDLLDSEVRARTGQKVSLLNDAHPTSLEAIARSRGAANPDEVTAFTQLVSTVSGPDRLRKAFGAAADPVMAALFATLPVESRPLQGHLLVPELRYFEHQGKRVLLDTAVADWAQSCQKGEWAGYYRSDNNTAFLREEYLGQTNEGTSVLVHELGHAFGDTLCDRYPDLYASFKEARDTAFVELKSTPGKAFPTQYASTNASEFIAESFAVCFSPNRSRYRADSPQWQAALQSALEAVQARPSTDSVPG